MRMELDNFPKSDKFPKEFNTLIEVPKDSTVKYEFDEDSGRLLVDRFMHGSMFYPFNYGFIPNTKADDGDALDVLVVSSYSVYPGAVVASRPIGMLETEDESGVDHKIIAVPVVKVDPFYAEVEDIQDLAEATRENIRNFFERHKELEPKKWIKVKNFHSRDVALELIKRSAQ